MLRAIALLFLVPALCACSMKQPEPHYLQTPCPVPYVPQELMQQPEPVRPLKQGATEADLAAWFLDYAERTRNMEAQLAAWRELAAAWAAGQATDQITGRARDRGNK